MIPTPPIPSQMPAPPWSSWEKWLQSPPGRYVLGWEQKCFDQIVADVFGFNAVQIGLPQINTLSENRMPMQAILIHSNDSLEYASKYHWHLIEGSSSELPFANESLDLVVLPHVLEFATDPHQILREVDRVLRPEGRLIISGFNPASLWGARQYLSRLIGSPYLPRDGQFIGLIRVKDWLQLLNFSLDRGHFGCYKFPLQGISSMNRQNILSKSLQSNMTGLAILLKRSGINLNNSIKSIKRSVFQEMVTLFPEILSLKRVLLRPAKV